MPFIKLKGNTSNKQMPKIAGFPAVRTLSEKEVKQISFKHFSYNPIIVFSINPFSEILFKNVIILIFVKKK